VLPEFCAAAELLRIRELLSALFEKKIGHAEGQQFDMLGLDLDANRMTQPQILNPSSFVPELLRTEHFRKVAAIARQLLGPHTQFSFDHAILKPARSSAATPWHQDEAHHTHRFFRYPQISFWMALQDTPIASGCMRYVPGSQRGPVLPHRRWHDDPRIQAMECPVEYFDESAAVARPVAAGACILHGGRTLHAALPNTSTEDRLAYIIAFVGPPQRVSGARFATVDQSANRSKPSGGQIGRPASEERRQRWLLRGGVLTALLRRIRQGLRSPPKIMWMKLRLLMRSLKL